MQKGHQVSDPSDPTNKDLLILLLMSKAHLSKGIREYPIAIIS